MWDANPTYPHSGFKQDKIGHFLRRDHSRLFQIDAPSIWGYYRYRRDINKVFGGVTCNIVSAWNMRYIASCC